jgi:hypothetical protein
LADRAAATHALRHVQVRIGRLVLPLLRPYSFSPYHCYLSENLPFTMHRYRDALLAPEPQGVPQASGSERSVIDQQDIVECIARGELEEVRTVAFRNRTWAVTNKYCFGSGTDSLQGPICSIWHMYYQLSRHAPHDKPENDSLVLDILRIQGLGPLTRPTPNYDNNDIDIARTADGVLWNDLPFFATDMTKYWMEYAGSMSGAHRLNFSAFLAKLASTRVSKDRLCQIALHLFRYAFEEARALRIGDEPDEEDKHRTLHNLSHIYLLPSVCAWIKIAGHNLIMLSDTYWNDCPSDVGRGGSLFVASDFGSRSPIGFTPWRWMFWLKRLHEIRDEAKEADEQQIAELAMDAIERMVHQAKERNSEILRVYRNGGDFLSHEPHLSCLKNGLDA